MVEKELRKLKRQELLQLLLTQVKETEEIQGALTESQNQVQELEGSLDRLKARLDEKDAQIERLKARLDLKDERIHRLREYIERYQKSRRIELNEAGNIAEAALRLNRIFEEAQKTAEQYLYNISLMCGGEPDEDEMDGENLQKFLDGMAAEEMREALEDEGAAAAEEIPEEETDDTEKKEAEEFPEKERGRQ